jgi:Family of unknown function (DUF5990)
VTERHQLAVEIVGHDMPGRSCGPDPDGKWCENVHAGLKRGTDTIELVAGDAPAARWSFTIAVRQTRDGWDYGGPYVSGDRSDRHLGIRWVEIGGDGTMSVFRGAKLRLVELDGALIDDAIASGRRLIARVDMTDEHGWPRCARVRPPAIEWSLGAAETPQQP